MAFKNPVGTLRVRTTSVSVRITLVVARGKGIMRVVTVRKPMPPFDVASKAITMTPVRRLRVGELDAHLKIKVEELPEWVLPEFVMLAAALSPQK